MLDDRDHLAVPGVAEHDRAAALPEMLAQDGVVLLHAEEDDLAAGGSSHAGRPLVVGVEHRLAVAEDRLGHDRLDLGQVVERVDAAQAEVVGGDVGDDGDVAAVEAEARAEDAAAGGLEHGVVDGRVLEHHLRAGRAAHVAGQDLGAVDVDAVGGGHADAPAGRLHDVRDHPDGGRLAVRAGDRHDRDPGAVRPAGTACRRRLGRRGADALPSGGCACGSPGRR